MLPRLPDTTALPDTETPQARLVRRRMFFLLAAAALAAPVAAQTSDQSSPPSQAGDSTNAQTLYPGDVVRLRIWREPDMSGDYPVDQTGVVVFPKLGEYHVLDYTPLSLRARLLADYSRYLRNPSIEIIVLRRIRITGAVNTPGLHMLDPTVTIADALAAAGGATPIGDPNKIQIIREGKTIAVNIRQDLRITDSPIRSGDQIYVPERSWFSRNSNVVATSIAASVSLIIALFIRH